MALATATIRRPPSAGGPRARVRRLQNGYRPPRTVVSLAVLTALVASTPIWFLLLRAAGAGLDGIATVVSRPGFTTAVLSSLALTLVVGVLATVLGIGTALLVGRTAMPFRRFWTLLLVLPLAVPSYVAAFAWVALFPTMRGFWAAVLVLTLASAPLVVLPVLAALRQGEASVEEVARSLGAGRARVLLTVTLPAIWPGALAGSLLVMLYTLAEFGTVAIFRVDALTRSAMLSFTAAFDRTSAIVQSLALVAIAVVLVLLERRVRGRSQRWSMVNGAPRPPRLVRLGRPATVLSSAGLALLAVLSIGVPMTALILRLLAGIRGGLDPGDVWAAALSTAWVSFLGAVIAVLLALPVAYLGARFPGAHSRVVETACYAGHALPGVVVGLALVVVTLSLFPGLYQTLAVLALAYAVLFLPKAIGSARAAIGAVPPSLELLARSQGRNAASAFAGVTARLASPGIMAGALLVMVTAMKELPATLMLRPTGMETLATRMWARTEIAAYGAAAPYAFALVIVAAIPTLLLARGLLVDRSRAHVAAQAPGDGNLAV